MSLSLSLLGAFGLLLIYQGLTGRPAAESPKALLRLRRLLDEAGLSALAPMRFLGICLLSSLTVAIVIIGFTSSPLIGGTFALAAGWLPIAVARSRRIKRRRRFREAWPDAIATLISGVRAGLSLAEACTAVSERGPVDLRDGFTHFRSSYRATGSFSTALERLRLELSDPVADRIVVSLRLAHEVGGTDLIRVLRTLSNFVREDLRLRKEIEARWSWTVSAARVAAAAPWIVLLLMSTQPEALRAYNSATGLAVMGFGALSTAVGYRLMLRAGRLPEQERLGP